MTVAIKMKKVRKGVYESTSTPKKVDNDRIRQIINREPPRQRQEEPEPKPRSATVQAG